MFPSQATIPLAGDLGSVAVTVASDDLTDVPPESVPLVITEHLSEVQATMLKIVGDDIFAGVAFTDADSGGADHDLWH